MCIFAFTNSSAKLVQWYNESLFVYVLHLCSITNIKIHITVYCNLEQNVYSNQKEELDKRLNHSEHSIFIEYLYIVMIKRQKIKTNIQMENEENSVSNIALHF